MTMTDLELVQGGVKILIPKEINKIFVDLDISFPFPANQRHFIIFMKNVECSPVV